MKLNICIEGTPEEVNQVIGSWKEDAFIEFDAKLMALKSRIGSLEAANKLTDSAISNLKTGTLKVTGTVK